MAPALSSRWPSESSPPAFPHRVAHFHPIWAQKGNTVGIQEGGATDRRQLARNVPRRSVTARMHRTRINGTIGT